MNGTAMQRTRPAHRTRAATPAPHRARRVLPAGLAPALGLAALLVLGGCLADEGPEPAAAPGEATWAAVSDAMDAEGCPGCHPSLNPPDLGDCAALVNVASSAGQDYVEPGDPSTSYLYRVATGDVLPGGQDMSMGSGNVDTLAAWIVDGANCP